MSQIQRPPAGGPRSARPGRAEVLGVPDPDLLTLQWDVHDGCVVLAVAGELDLSSVPQLRDAVDRLLSEPALGDPSGFLVIDLAEVTFLDCSGVNALIAARRGTSDPGRLALVCRADSFARQVLDLTGVAEAVPLYDSVPEALGGEGGADA